jgi:uncharacterized protein
VQHFFETLSSGDLEALRPMLHPDATWEVMRAEPRSRFSEGRDAIVDEFLAPVRGRFHPGDPQVIVDTLVASGRMVAAETRAVGAMLNGIAYANRYAWMIEIDESTGLVLHVREYMDTAYAQSTR